MSTIERDHAGSIRTTTPEVWPPDGETPVYLAPAASDVERTIVRDAVARLAGVEDPTIVFGGEEALAAAEGTDRPIAPVRVLWLPPGGEEGTGTTRFATVRALSRAGAPSRILQSRQRRVLARDPDRCRVVVGAPATRAELETRWRERTGSKGKTTSDSSAPSSAAESLPSFVERAADIALERAERRITGDRYRAPRRVVDEIVADRKFQEAAEELARRLNRQTTGVVADARMYLEEMSTEQQPAARDVWARWSRFLHRAYDVQVDPQQVERIRALAEDHPLVFLPSHRSNLDGFVMASVMYDQGFAPNHTLGGINMAFWPLGAMGRRNGVIFIRRTFRGNEVYKFALRRYLAFLVSKRFNLEWYIEGGRSRTGKLIPPRLGLFNYLADAVEDLGTDAIRVIPVSMVYDELEEVREMTSESRGAVKPAEGAKWLFDFARSQRGHFGAIHVNFGEPLDLAASLRHNGGLGPDVDDKTKRLARSKSSFEVLTRINRATPVTDTSLVTLALLAGDDRALTMGEVCEALEPLIAYVTKRGIPGADSAEALRAAPRVERVLATLETHGVVERFVGGRQPVFRIGPDQELVAAFYRNAGIHWFVNRAILELALLAVIQKDGETDGRDLYDVGLDDALAIRDLLKFEFFFPEKEEFRLELREELSLIDPKWRERGPSRMAELGEEFNRSGALMAHRVLRSFIEAYAIVADHLAASGDTPVETDDVVERCLELGRQYRLQRFVSSEEALSTHLFRSAMKLAANRDLVDAGEGLAGRRALFAQELGDVLRRLREVDELDRSRPRRTAPSGVAA